MPQNAKQGSSVCGGDDVAAHSPDELAPKLQSVSRRVVGEHDRVGSRQRCNRLAQPSRRQQRILRVGGCDQHDVEVARQPPMLKAVVQQVQLRAERRFSQSRLPGDRSSPTMTGTPSLRAISSGSSPKSRAAPFGSTTATPCVSRRYPRESTSKAMPRCFSNSPSRMRNGVLPEPPTVRLPMLTTGPCRRLTGISARGRRVRCARGPLRRTALRADSRAPLRGEFDSGSAVQIQAAAPAAR